jgi:hypothetical protein
MSSVVVAKSSGSKPPTRAGAIHGAPISSSSTTTISTTAHRVKSTDNTWSRSCSCCGVVYSLSTGTSAEESIPPTSSSYTILGTALTASKALVAPEAPNEPAMTASRTKPSRRLAMLPAELMAASRATEPVPGAPDGITSSGSSTPGICVTELTTGSRQGRRTRHRDQRCCSSPCGRCG